MLSILRVRYGKANPNKKRCSEKKWNALWQTSGPIKDLFFCLETCFIIVVVLKPPYMKPQMVNKAYTAIQEMRLFAIVCLDWNAMGSNR